MKLFVAGLPSDFDDVDFKEMFELYGTVASAKIIIDHNTQKSKGFGFLEMTNQAEATAVISTLNGVKMSGKPLVVKEATEQAQRPSTGGGFRPQRSNDARPRFNSGPRDNNRDYGNRDNSRDYNRDGSRDYNRDGGRDYNRDGGRDYNRNNNRDRQSDQRY